MKNNKKDKTPENVVVSDTDNVKEEKPKKKYRGKKFIALYIAAGVFVIYAVISLISQQSQINKKRAELDLLNKKIEVQELKNQKLTDIYNLSDKDNEEYIEKKAKEDGYLHSGERVFINISGN